MSDYPDAPMFDHLWRSRSIMTDRVGQKLRILALGTMNTAMVEFEDGHRCVTSQFGYHRQRTPDDCSLPRRAGTG